MMMLEINMELEKGNCDTDQPLEFCPNCKGRGWVPNIYNKPSLCMACAGECVIKRCPICNVLMPASDSKCFICLLKSAPDLSNDPDFEAHECWS